MKKIAALILALLMVVSLAFTVSADAADPYTSNITVKGLSAGDATTINLFQIISLDEDANNWVIADWATGYVTLDGDEYEVSDDVVNAPVANVYATRETSATVEVFEDVPVGAYVVVASGAKAAYTKMIANTYDAEALYMAAKDATVVAKTSGYEVTKEASDKFVSRGQEVIFTVETIYPSFEKNAVNKTYKLIDTSDDLLIESVESVMIGGVAAIDYAAAYDAENANDYVIDLTATIDENNENAGKTVVVTYKAIVLTEAGYENTVNAFRNEIALDPQPPVVNGYTGDITITKKDEATKKVLNGAEFTVAKQTGVDEEQKPVYGGTLAFVELEAGVYKLAKEGDEETVTTIAAPNGTVQVKGLDEGTYHFTETKAPAG